MIRRARRGGKCSASRISLKSLRYRCLASFPDRKSTRLNSSHSQISYAVFCLKKKTNAEFRLLLPHLSLFTDLCSPDRTSRHASHEKSPVIQQSRSRSATALRAHSEYPRTTRP